MLNKNNQNGRSTIEMLAVLAIIAILTVGGIAGYSKAMSKFKTGKVLDQTQSIIVEIRTFYSGSNDYNGLNTASAVNNQILTGNIVISNNARHAFGGEYRVGRDIDGTTGIIGDKSFYVSLYDLGQSSCINILSAAWADSAASGLALIKVRNSNGTTDFTWGNPNADLALPVDLNKAGKICANDASNIIGLEYN